MGLLQRSQMTTTPKQVIASAIADQTQPLACVGFTRHADLADDQWIVVRFIFSRTLESVWSRRTSLLTVEGAKALFDYLKQQGYAVDHASEEERGYRTSWLSAPNSLIGGVWGNMVLTPRMALAVQ